MVIRKHRPLLVVTVSVALALSGCGHETKVTRVDIGVVTDLSGRWNDTDSRMVAEAMVKDALQYPVAGEFRKDEPASARRRRGDGPEQQSRTYQRANLHHGFGTRTHQFPEGHVRGR